MEVTGEQPGAGAVRSTYGLADGTPEPVRVVACREALSVLRPQLSRIWISILPAGGQWPPGLDGDGAELLRLSSQEQEARPPAPRRPGAGPDVVGTDPADTRQFTVVHRLAPSSTSVAAMSRDGKLLLDAGPGRWLLRLTADEHATLQRRLSGHASGSPAWLVRVEVPESGGLRRLEWVVVLSAVFAGPEALRHGLSGLTSVSWSLDTLRSVGWLLFGVFVIVGGVWELVRFVVRWWQGRGRRAARRSAGAGQPGSGRLR